MMLPRVVLSRAGVRAGLFAALGAACGVGLLPSRPVVSLAAGAVAGSAGGRAAARSRIRRGEAAADDAMAEVVDLLACAVLAGLPVERALRLAAREELTHSAGSPVAEALSECVRALDLGVPREEAYGRLARRTGGTEAPRLVACLVRSARYGTPLSGALSAHAAEVRARMRARAEAEARTAPVRLIFPLVVCFLPAFVVLALAPLVLAALSTLRGS